MEWKANEKVAKVVEKAVGNITNTAGRGHGHARGQEVLDEGRDKGKVQRRARVLILFPMELSNQLDSSKTEDNENLMESHTSTPSNHHTHQICQA